MKNHLFLLLAATISLIFLVGAALVGPIQAYDPPHADDLFGPIDFSAADKGIFNGELTPVVFMPVLSKIGCRDFYDDFSNPNSGWLTGADTLFQYDYIDNEFQIKSIQSGYTFLLQSPSCQREFYSAEVSGHWLGATGNSYGLIFLIKGNYDTFFIFDINTDLGEYRIVRKIGGQPADVPYHGSSSAILSGNAWNRLQVFVNGPWVTFRVNNQFIRKEWFGAPTEGLAGAGITAGPYNDRPVAEARFDDFVMRQLTPGEMVSDQPVIPADAVKPWGGISAGGSASWPGLDFVWPEGDQE